MSRRVLMTADTVGGVWTYALDLVRELKEVDFVLATMGRLPSEEQAAQAAALKNLELHTSAYKLEWMDDPWDDLHRAGAWLLEIEADFKPDLIHHNGLVHGALPFHAPKLVVVHSDVLSWWQAVKDEPAPTEWNRYRDEVTKSLRTADLVAAPSRAMLAEAIRLYGPFDRTAALPNGREGFAAKPKEPFVFAAGRMWDEAKNIAALNTLELDWPVRIAGDGSPLGWRTSAEIADLMARAAIYALPARYEPFGLSVLEAALAGCALVLGDIPTLRENWDGRALFVDPNDPVALQAAIQSLIDDPVEREWIAERAKERAAELDLRSFGDGYRAAYGMLAPLR